MRKFLIGLANSTHINSFANKMRKKRFKIFLDFIKKIEAKYNRPLEILDIGGSENFWEMMGYLPSQHNLTILNLHPCQCSYKNLRSVVGDARNMSQFPDMNFDVVFSNSVIEHLGTFEDQKKMANEIKRLAPFYFLQTPSYYFPIEQHFLFPFFHWFPKKIRIWMIMNFSLGWFDKNKNLDEATKLVDEIRLLKHHELKLLFPEAQIVKEKFLGLIKSYIVIKSL